MLNTVQMNPGLVQRPQDHILFSFLMEGPRQSPTVSRTPIQVKAGINVNLEYIIDLYQKFYKLTLLFFGSKLFSQS